MSEPRFNQDFLDSSSKIFKELGVIDLQWLPLSDSLFNPNLRIWIEEGFHGDMDWLERTVEKRENPKEAFSEFQSVALILVPYYRSDSAQKSEQNGISIYAQGRDYHKVVWKILKQGFLTLASQFPSLTGKWYCDTGPVSEKWLASQTSLGWIGKNTNLIRKAYGSYFFIGALFTNQEVPPNQAATNHCGNCVRCINHCPTQALIEPYKIDARLCLSYQTIERKGPFDKKLQTKDWLYGCDVCQTVCPWNRFKQESPFEDFKPRENYDWLYFLTLDEDRFLKEFEGSPIRRIGYIKFTENLLILLAAQEDLEESLLNEVKKKSQSSNPQIRSLALEIIDRSKAQS